MKALRTAILGCGGFAHVHARNLLALPDDFQLAAFCSRRLSSARQFSEQYTGGRGQIFSDPHEMFEKAGLDLVVVCLPPAGHSDEVQQAAQHGVHILMEKPIALTSEHAWSMVAAAEDAGIKTQVGFMFRFGLAVERLKSLLERGEAGAAGLMSARYFCNSLHTPWWRKREESGGQLVEQVIHMVDLMRCLMGEAVSVYSRQENIFHRQVEDYSVEDVSATVFGFESGALGVIYATNGAVPGQWTNDYRLVAQTLTAEFSDANHAVFHHTAETPPRSETVGGERDVYMAELQDLLGAIRGGGPTRIPLREGAKSLDLALAATRSAQARREILLD